MANVRILESGRSAVRRRSRPLAGLPLAPVVSLQAQRKQARQETPAERAERLNDALTEVVSHVLALIDILVEARHGR